MTYSKYRTLETEFCLYIYKIEDESGL